MVGPFNSASPTQPTPPNERKNPLRHGGVIPSISGEASGEPPFHFKSTRRAARNMPALAEQDHHDALSLFASRLSRQHRFGDDDLRLLEAALSAGADVPALLATRSAARRLLQQRAKEAFAALDPLLDQGRSLASADFFARAFALVGDVESCLAMRYEALLLRDAKYSDNHHLQVSRQEWLTFAKDSLDNGFYTIASKACAHATAHIHRSHPGQLGSTNSIEKDEINDIIGLQNLAKSLSAQHSDTVS
ncbi:hypothetical protein SETIT_8G019300v2 [Setaria italica]|uniref:Uncharacterized protein n=2 Tax=Setaria italica TaxID=4555 RepID=A0A368S3B6_SETIT|nr:uncharacterized protein LOC101778482 isoform X2 [Setaria italica]RCV36908.1 hypothetical protein SETIT_8G019300v2 [Setaria italica]